MTLAIKIIIILTVVGLLRVLIWRESRKNSWHNFIKYHFGSQEIAPIIYTAWISISLGAGIVVFSWPDKNLGFIIGAVIGLIGVFIGM